MQTDKLGDVSPSTRVSGHIEKIFVDIHSAHKVGYAAISEQDAPEGATDSQFR
jgi:hypothetical protein